MTELREDLAEIFIQSLKQIDLNESFHTVNHWGGNHSVRTVTEFDIRGEVHLSWMNEEAEKTLQIFRGWMGERLKVDIGSFKGVTPVSMEMQFDYATGNKILHTRYTCDYVEDGYADMLPNRTYNERKERVMNHEFGQNKKKKEDHFEKDLFEV